MGTISEKLEYLYVTKDKIAEAIQEKGVDVSTSDTFRSYADKIKSIKTSSGIPYTINNKIPIQKIEGPEMEGSDTSIITTNGETYVISYDFNENHEYNFNNFDTSLLTSLSASYEYMEDYDVYSVRSGLFMFGPKTLEVGDWNTDNVTEMIGTFNMCFQLESLDLSGWNTSNVTNMDDMFGYCYALTSLDLSSFDFSKITTFQDGLFYKCITYERDTTNKKMIYTKNLVSLIGSHTLEEVQTGTITVFNGLTCEIYLGSKVCDYNYSSQFYEYFDLNYSTLLAIVKGIGKVSGITLHIGSSNLSKLSSSDKKIATDKGWTLA